MAPTPFGPGAVQGSISGGSKANETDALIFDYSFIDTSIDKNKNLYLYSYPPSTYTRTDDSKYQTQRFTLYNYYNGFTSYQDLGIRDFEQLQITGTSRGDRIHSGAGNDILNGGDGVDTISGNGGSDTFAFAYGHSSIEAPDVITDFAIGTSRIAILQASGATVTMPAQFSRAADSNAATLATLVSAALQDADGALVGNQPLAASSAVLIKATNSAIAGTYLLINNASAGLDSGADGDLLIKLTSPSGSLPALGSISPSLLFASTLTL